VTAEGVKVQEVGVNVGAREAGERGMGVGGGDNTTAVFARSGEMGRQGVAEICVVFECGRP
jgi:hypothetical protein